MAQWSVLVKSVILYCNILYACPLLSWTTKYVCFLPVEPPVPELHLGSGFVMRPNDFFLAESAAGRRSRWSLMAVPLEGCIP